MTVVNVEPDVIKRDIEGNRSSNSNNSNRMHPKVEIFIHQSRKPKSVKKKKFPEIIKVLFLRMKKKHTPTDTREKKMFKMLRKTKSIHTK